MYKKGDFVEVNFDGAGWLAGVVREVYPHYGFHGGELKFEIHGTKKLYITITSPRRIRHLTKRAADLPNATVSQLCSHCHQFHPSNVACPDVTASR